MKEHYRNEQPVIREIIAVTEVTWIVYAEYDSKSCTAIIHRTMNNETSGNYTVYALNADTDFLRMAHGLLYRPSRIISRSLSFGSPDDDETTMIQRCMNTVFGFRESMVL